MSIWICLIIGILIGFLVASALKSQLKSVYSASAAAEYITEGSLNLTIKTDRYLYENTTRTPKAKSNDKN